MRKAELVRAGSNAVLVNGSPLPWDFRVVADNNYQDILQTFKEIRDWDIKRYLNGDENNLIPLDLRRKIQDFLEQHNL